MIDNFATIYRKLGYTFVRSDLLALALTHRSYSYQNNERLEFLGDGILNMIIAKALYQQFPKANEGQLTQLRSLLVREQTLANIATQLGLGEFLHLGSGELKSGGMRRASICADALEAIVAAIYLDADLTVCEKCVLNWFAPSLATVSLESTSKDSKTQLQEYLQQRKLALPVYTIIAMQGDASEQSFKVNCIVEALAITTEGEGNSRRSAEQIAATKALELIK